MLPSLGLLRQDYVQACEETGSAGREIHPKLRRPSPDWLNFRRLEGVRPTRFVFPPTPLVLAGARLHAVWGMKHVHGMKHQPNI